MTHDTLQMVIESTIKRTLEELGIVSDKIYRKEMIVRIGRTKLDRAFREGELIPMKGFGRTSKVYCSRKDFDTYEKKQRFITNQ